MSEQRRPHGVGPTIFTKDGGIHAKARHEQALRREKALECYADITERLARLQRLLGGDQ